MRWGSLDEREGSENENEGGKKEEEMAAGHVIAGYRPQHLPVKLSWQVTEPGIPGRANHRTSSKAQKVRFPPEFQSQEPGTHQSHKPRATDRRATRTTDHEKKKLPTLRFAQMWYHIGS